MIPDRFSSILLTQIYQYPILLFLYKLWKFIYRYFTGTTELYRICSEIVKIHSNKFITNLSDSLNKSTSKDEREFLIPKLHPALILRIDKSILFSSQLLMERRSLESKITEKELDQVIEKIAEKKSFNSLASPAGKILHKSCFIIFNSYKLMHELNSRSATKYDPVNVNHEKKLMELWNLLRPNIQLQSRRSKQWIQIGFQGDDPTTDFRGMGILGLDDLVYFCKYYKDLALETLAISNHTTAWFPFAITGINITAFTLQLVRLRHLQFHFYKFGSTKDIYHEFYCYLFYNFGQYWNNSNNILTIMDFNNKFNEFKFNIIKDLENRKDLLLIKKKSD